MDSGEIIKYTITVLQEVKDKDHPRDNITNVGDIKFYIISL